MCIKSVWNQVSIHLLLIHISEGNGGSWGRRKVSAVPEIFGDSSEKEKFGLREDELKLDFILIL